MGGGRHQARVGRGSSPPPLAGLGPGGAEVSESPLGLGPALKDRVLRVRGSVCVSVFVILCACQNFCCCWLHSGVWGPQVRCKGPRCSISCRVEARRWVQKWPHPPSPTLKNHPCTLYCLPAERKHANNMHANKPYANIHRNSQRGPVDLALPLEATLGIQAGHRGAGVRSHFPWPLPGSNSPWGSRSTSTIPTSHVYPLRPGSPT